MEGKNIDKINGCKFVLNSILEYEEKDYPQIFKKGVINIKKENGKTIYHMDVSFEFAHEEDAMF